MVANGATLIAAAANLTTPIYPGVLQAELLALSGKQYRIRVGTPPAAGSIYGGRHVLNGVKNLSDSILLFSCGSVQPNDRVTAVTSLSQADGIMIAIFDGNGNYRRWNVFSGSLSIAASPLSGSPTRVYAIDTSAISTMQEQSAIPPDLTNIVAFEYHAKNAFQGLAVDFRVSNIYKVSKSDGITLAGSNASFDDLADYRDAQEQLFFLEEDLAAKTYVMFTPLTIATESMEDALSTIIYPANAANSVSDPRFHVDNNLLKINIPASGNANLSGLQVKSAVQNIVGNFTVGSGGTFNLSNFILGTASNINLAGGSLSNGVFADFGTITINGAEISNISFSGGTQLILSSFTNELTFTVNDVDSVSIYFVAGDYSNVIGSLEDGQVVNLSGGGGGSYDLSGLSGGTTEDPVIFDAIDGEAYVIQLGANINAAVSNPVTNGSITLAFPSFATTVEGIPQVTNVILAVIDLSDNSIAYPQLTGDSVELSLDAAKTYRITLDAPGYLAQSFTIPGNTPLITFELPNYRSIYENGVNRSNEISFDYSTLRVEISDDRSFYSFADVFRTIEDYLATEQGILFSAPPFPVVVGLGGGNVRNYLVFPVNPQTQAVNPVRIAPKASNTTDPLLSDFVVLLEGATSPLFDIWDFSAANGRTIRFQTEAISAGGSGGSVEIPADLEEKIDLIINLIDADYIKGETEIIKYIPGTQTVISAKDVAFTQIGFIVTKREEEE